MTHDLGKSLSRPAMLGAGAALIGRGLAPAGVAVQRFDHAAGSYAG